MMSAKKRFFFILVLALLALFTVSTSVSAAPNKTAFKGTDQFLYDIYLGDESIDDDGIYHVRNGLSVGLMTTTDPRVNGEYVFSFNGDFEFRPEPVFVVGYMWGTFRLENDGGWWEGTYTGYRDELGHSRFKYVGVGGGGYKGLKIKIAYKRLDADPSIPALLSGVVIEP